MSPIDQLLCYADTLTWAKGHLDDSSWFAFLRAGSLKVQGEQAAQIVAERIRQAGDHPKAGKLQRQIRRAYEHVGSHAGEVVPGTAPKAPKPVYQPDKLHKVAGHVGEVTPEWLKRISPVSTVISPAGFLHQVYQPEDKVLVFNVFESQGCEIWSYGRALNHLREDCFGVWFLSNPIDGKCHWNPREQKYSRRSEESITAWKYAVIESDEAPKNLWLRVLVQLPLPIMAIYDSGGASIHALVAINAESKAEWDRVVRVELMPMLVTLGACPGSLTAVRLTRLPNCRRGQTGRMQELLYLNPRPTTAPIKGGSTW